MKLSVILCRVALIALCAIAMSSCSSVTEFTKEQKLAAADELSFGF